MKAFIAYVNDALEELRHVRWPTRQQAIRFSAIVLAFTAACAAVFGVIDFGLTEFLQLLLTLA